MSPSASWGGHELIRPVVRYWRRAAAFFLVTVGLAGIGLVVYPRKYESESRLFVRIGHENATLDPTVTTGQIIALNASRETEINSIVELMGSRGVIEKTLDRIRPAVANASPEVREQVLRKLQASITVSSPRHSTVVTVRCRAESPEEARQTVAALVDVYLDEHMRMNRTTGSHEFFTQQAGLLKSQLDDAQASLRDVKNKYGLSSIDDRRRALESQTSEVEKQIGQVAAAFSASKEKISRLGQELEKLPQGLVGQLVGGTPNDGMAGMREELFKLRAREKELLSKYTPEHPKAIAIREEVRDVEAALQREQPRQDKTIDAVLARERATHDSLLAQQQSLAAQRADLQARLLELNQHEVLLSKLTREVQQLESRYLLYVGNSEQARVGRALEADRISNVSIVQPASCDPIPVSPRKSLVLALAILAGGGGAIGLAFLSDRLSESCGENGDAGVLLGLPGLEARPSGPGEKVVSR